MASSSAEAVMSERQTVDTYLEGPEDLRRRELVWGWVREPAAPRWGHQEIVTRITVRLYQHVHDRRIGRVVASPVDVVLDKPRALVVQPDVVFVSNERAGIVCGQVWGAPDLVVEVESSGTRRRDRVSKRQWYRHYGVREYWLVDPLSQTVAVLAIQESGRVRRRRFHSKTPLSSGVLPGLAISAADVFDDGA
jgi:Uma2 family endonuclease